MTPNKQALGTADITIPATAPMVRITAGAGTAGQKTWNLRRPVTLFGSRRPAHIVLHDKSICKAHCVIVHTGTDVLLKDLHTTAGTLRNSERINLVRLRDGDEIGIGSMRIQVAIRDPEGAPINTSQECEATHAAVFATSIALQLEHSDTRWAIRDAVSMIGRHPAAEIHLPHDAISARHAIMFRFQGAPAVYDLGSRSGVVVNGSRCTLAPLGNREQLGIGPCTLRVLLQDSKSKAEPERPQPSGMPPVPLLTSPCAVEEQLNEPAHRSASTNGDGKSLSRGGFTADTRLVETERQLDDLEENIAESWERLNNWRERIQTKADFSDGIRRDVSTLRAELDNKEAALRGLLHDLTRYHEQISERERELAKMLDGIGAEQEKLTKARLECVERTSELADLERRLKRSENALAQRWARLNTTTCAHCGKPTRGLAANPVDNLI